VPFAMSIKASMDSSVRRRPLGANETEGSSHDGPHPQRFDFMILFSYSPIWFLTIWARNWA